METARDLALRLRDLLRHEHGALTDFLLALATFDARRLWAELEYGSLFDFLHRELGLSKGAAFYRKTAVALVRDFPAVADALRDGASGNSRPERSVAPRTAWRSTTSHRGQPAARLRSRTAGSRASRTTCSRRGGSSATR